MSEAPVVDWSRVHLLIGTPSGRGFKPECIHALFSIKEEIVRRGGKVSFASSRAPLISLARGVLFLSALERPDGTPTDVTHYLSLDDDLMIGGNDVCRMIETGFPVVGAAYRLKFTNGVIQFVALFGPDQIDQEPVNGTLGMLRIGGGCILYQRGALELLRARYGTFAWGGHKGMSIAIEYVDDDGTFLTEDYATCDRWRAIGGSVRLMLDCATDHINADGDHFPGSFVHIWKVRHELLEGRTLGRYVVLIGEQGPDDVVKEAQDAQAARAVQAAKDAVASVEQSAPLVS